MPDFSKDPIINVIHRQIKQGIRVTIDNECFGSALILIYSGIDTMAFLNMPPNQEDVTRTDFIVWTEKYIQFPCKEQVTGLELYGARCGLLHSYTIFSKLSRERKCRYIGYTDQMIPEIKYDKEINVDFVMVSIKAFADAFMRGIDQFLIDVFSDSEKARIVEQRLGKLIHLFSANETRDGT
ncbi:MAG: hypothetical protein GWN01_04920 [Nitrosopumilaceae archaeon]|nr:hypothetical protein [Nitrosopumilaceae archaeon]NIV65392.1 hypothetical protein [Nitrosopumilaceae archaeon]NIX60887.1 hypothetical protein [Nitrosopumilaceae archaeon]